jgi:hypothetical protein
MTATVTWIPQFQICGGIRKDIQVFPAYDATVCSIHLNPPYHAVPAAVEAFIKPPYPAARSRPTIHPSISTITNTSTSTNALSITIPHPRSPSPGPVVMQQENSDSNDHVVTPRKTDVSTPSERPEHKPQRPARQLRYNKKMQSNRLQVQVNLSSRLDLKTSHMSNTPEENGSLEMTDIANDENIVVDDGDDDDDEDEDSRFRKIICSTSTGYLSFPNQRRILATIYDSNDNNKNVDMEDEEDKPKEMKDYEPEYPVFEPKHAFQDPNLQANAMFRVEEVQGDNDDKAENVQGDNDDDAVVVLPQTELPITESLVLESQRLVSAVQEPSLSILSSTEFSSVESAMEIDASDAVDSSLGAANINPFFFASLDASQRMIAMNDGDDGDDDIHASMDDIDQLDDVEDKFEEEEEEAEEQIHPPGKTTKLKHHIRLQCHPYKNVTQATISFRCHKRLSITASSKLFQVHSLHKGDACTRDSSIVGQ